MITLGSALEALIREHEYCRELDAGVEDDRVWMTCTCGAVIDRRLEAACANAAPAGNVKTMGATKAAFLTTSLLVVPSGRLPDIGRSPVGAGKAGGGSTWQVMGCAGPCQREMVCIVMPDLKAHRVAATPWRAVHGAVRDALRRADG